MSALSLADVQTHLNNTSDADAGELQKMINRAEAAVGTRVGPLVPVTVTENVRATANGTLILSRWPVASLVSITPFGDVAMDLTDVDFDSGIVSYLSGASFTTGPSVYAVVYQHGWASAPEDVLLGTLELIRHFWDTQRGSGAGRPGPRPSDSAPIPGASYALPIRVEQLLEPYRVPKVA